MKAKRPEHIRQPQEKQADQVAGHSSTGPLCEVELDSYAFGGDAIGRMPTGQAIFVPFGMVGEKLRVRKVEEKQHYIRGEIVEFISKHPERIKAKCRHFQNCGGCQYQHIPYPVQLDIKQEIFTNQLIRMAGVPTDLVKPIIPSPNPFAYRNTVQLHLSPTGKLGYLKTNSHEVIEIEECPLSQKGIQDMFPKLVFDPSESMERIELRIGSINQLLMTIQSENAELPEMETDLPISVVHQSQAGSLVIAGDNFVSMEVLKKSFRVSSGAFFQVNLPVAENMVSYVLKNLLLTKESVLLDVYCGVGLFSAFLAPAVKHCIGIETSPVACDDYAYNLDAESNIELYQGRAELILPNLKVKPDAVIVDPPRAGLDKEALNAIVELAPEKIVYVSCDPATLARDIHRFSRQGYRLTSTQPFDQFPQTYHIESICILEKLSP